MKRKVILASHGGLAPGLLDTAQMILGRIEYNTEVYSLQPGHHPDEFAIQLRAEIEKEPDVEHVILCDLLGASVFSALYPLTAYQNVRLFTGMNLNMLLSICVDCPGPLDEEAVKKVKDSSCAGIQLAKIVESEQEDF